MLLLRLLEVLVMPARDGTPTLTSAPMHENATFLGRSFTRRGAAATVLGVLALSAGASLVDAASPPLWAAVAGGVLFLILLRAVFLAFSRPAQVRVPDHRASPEDAARASLAREEADRQQHGRGTR